MSTRHIRLCITISQPHLIAALEDVAGEEEGETLNDHCSFQDYIIRRGSYLSGRPVYKTSNTPFFPLARRDAQLIFSSEHEKLSIQEIRRRELREQIVPLLPLRTKVNTYSIDNFQSYPRSEWIPMMQSQAGQASRQSRRADGSSTGGWSTSSTPSLTNNSYGGNQGVSTAVPQLPNHSQVSSSAGNPIRSIASNALITPEYLSMALASSAIAESPGSQQQRHHSQAEAPVSALQPETLGGDAGFGPMIHQANTTKQLMSITQAEGPHSSSSPLSPRLSTSQSSLRQSTSYLTHPSSSLREARSNSTYHMATPPQQGLTPTKHATTRLGNSYVPRDPGVVRVPEGVSALASRAMYVPVKPQRGKKRTKATTQDEDVESESSETSESVGDASPPPRKLLVLNVGKKPKAKSTKTEPLLKGSTKKTKSNATLSDHVEAVIAGKAQPKGPSEAKKAAEIRHSRLLAQHNVSMESGAGGTRKAARVDFLPEFFETSNFPKGMEQDTVRCVCGALEDDNIELVECEGCNVWQHIHCMGEAVPKDLENEDYHCQMCDPYAHRKLIAELRKTSPLAA